MNPWCIGFSLLGLLTPQLSCCRQLDLQGNNLGPEGAKALAPALVTGVLTSLDVRYNYMGRAGESAMQKAVKGREGFALQL